MLCASRTAAAVVVAPLSGRTPRGKVTSIGFTAQVLSRVMRCKLAGGYLVCILAARTARRVVCRPSPAEGAGWRALHQVVHSIFVYYYLSIRRCFLSSRGRNAASKCSAVVAVVRGRASQAGAAGSIPPRSLLFVSCCCRAHAIRIIFPGNCFVASRSKWPTKSRFSRAMPCVFFLPFVFLLLPHAHSGCDRRCVAVRVTVF